MSPEAPCWQKLKGRRTLVNNEQCLLDLDERLQALESQWQSSAPNLPAPGAAGGPAGLDYGSDGTETSAPISEAPERLPDVEPIPVRQRLPELHELDRQGRCWAYRSTTHEPLGRAWVLGTPVSLQLTRPWCSFTHWLPHWSLPVVPDEDDQTS